MENQLRHNEGKARLSYFFANRRALHRLASYYETDRMEYAIEEFRGRYDFLLSGILGNLAVYLASGPRGTIRPLAYAFLDTLLLLEYDREGSLDHLAVDREVVGLLCTARSALDDYCAVCIQGETKYPRGNYRLGAPITDYCDCALRHLKSYGAGGRIDLESGQPHLAHLLWNLWQALDQPTERDNRLAAVQHDTVAPSPRDGTPVVLTSDDPDFETKIHDLLERMSDAVRAHNGAPPADVTEDAPPSSDIN